MQIDAGTLDLLSAARNAPAISSWVTRLAFAPKSRFERNLAKRQSRGTTGAGRPVANRADARNMGGAAGCKPPFAEALDMLARLV